MKVKIRLNEGDRLLIRSNNTEDKNFVCVSLAEYCTELGGRLIPEEFDVRGLKDISRWFFPSLLESLDIIGENPNAKLRNVLVDLEQNLREFCTTNNNAYISIKKAGLIKSCFDIVIQNKPAEFDIVESGMTLEQLGQYLSKVNKEQNCGIEC